MQEIQNEFQQDSVGKWRGRATAQPTTSSTCTPKTAADNKVGQEGRGGHWRKQGHEDSQNWQKGLWLLPHSYSASLCCRRRLLLLLLGHSGHSSWLCGSCRQGRPWGRLPCQHWLLLLLLLLLRHLRLLLWQWQWLVARQGCCMKGWLPQP